MKYDIGVYKVVRDYSRDSGGKFVEKVSTRVKRFVRRLPVYVMVVSVSVMFLGMLTNNFAFIERWFVPLEYVAVAEAAEVAGQPDKIEAAKRKVIDELEKCESAGLKEADGIAILDTNNVGSYGPLQFQRKTVMYYYEKMTGNKISGRDALILALQGDKARELAYFIIYKTDSGIDNDWVRCAAKYDLTGKVELLKELSE